MAEGLSLLDRQPRQTIGNWRLQLQGSEESSLDTAEYNGLLSEGLLHSNEPQSYRTHRRGAGERLGGCVRGIVI